jgi:acetyltransferase
MDAARARGLKTIEGEVLANNANMLHLCAKLGFSLGAVDEDAGIRKVSRPL